MFFSILSVSIRIIKLRRTQSVLPSSDDNSSEGFSLSNAQPNFQTERFDIIFAESRKRTSMCP